MADNTRIVCRNLAPWEVGFQRKNSLGDITIQPNAKVFIDEQEIKAQCYSNNILFVGRDGKGSHARIYIEDEAIRKELGFDSEDGKEKQNLLDDEKLKRIFDYKRQADFERAIRESVVEHFEKFMLLDYIKRASVNDYRKIRFIEEYVWTRID